MILREVSLSTLIFTSFSDSKWSAEKSWSRSSSKSRSHSYSRSSLRSKSHSKSLSSSKSSESYDTRYAIVYCQHGRVNSRDHRLSTVEVKCGEETDWMWETLDEGAFCWDDHEHIEHVDGEFLDLILAIFQVTAIHSRPQVPLYPVAALNGRPTSTTIGLHSSTALSDSSTLLTTPWPLLPSSAQSGRHTNGKPSSNRQNASRAKRNGQPTTALSLTLSISSIIQQA